MDKLLKLSDETVDFIKKYLIKEMHINGPIDNDIICDIVEYCNTKYDDQFVAKELNPNYVIEDPDKCWKAGSVVSDITGKWSKDNTDVDLDDLNKRLGLK